MAHMLWQDKRNCFTFLWTLENVSYNWQNRNESIISPTFVIHELQESRHHLELFLCGKDDDKYIDIYLQGERLRQFEPIDCEIALLSIDGSVLTFLKKDSCEVFVDFLKFKEIKDIFFANKKTYLSENKLRVRCRIWKSDGGMAENIQCFARTRFLIQTQSLLLNIPNFGSIESEEKCSYQIKSVPDSQVLVTLNILKRNPYTDEDSINIQLIAENRNIKNFNLHLIPFKDFSSATKSIRKEFFFSEKEKQKLLTLPFSKNDLIANNYFQDNFLKFKCECTFSTGDIFEEIEKVVYGCENFPSSEADKQGLDEEYVSSISKRILCGNFKSMFLDSILSDIKLKTSSNTYFAHKSILSARSPVFKAMFSNDMKENFNECVDIDDLDSDTVYRMLHYVYTADVQELQWESACELYRAADKYEILALRDECSAYLKSKLSRTNACDLLIFADTFQDNGLKHSVQEFIFDHDIINSDEWIQLMENYLKLAADTMRLNIQRKLISSKFNTPTHGLDGNDSKAYCASPALDLLQCPSFQFYTSLSQAPPPSINVPFQFVSRTVSAPRKIRKRILRAPRKD